MEQQKVERLFCPLVLAQKGGESIAKCREEGCAWYVVPDKTLGKPGCAILKLGEATLKR